MVGSGAINATAFESKLQAWLASRWLASSAQRPTCRSQRRRQRWRQLSLHNPPWGMVPRRLERTVGAQGRRICSALKEFRGVEQVGNF